MRNFYKKHPRTSGGKETKLYCTWRSMRERCLSPKSDNWANYGGRGIQICPAWDSFNFFANWAIENGYEDGLTIEREDVNGNYEPSNCCWATRKEQGENKRNSCFVTINGVTKTVADWSAQTGIYITTLYRRYSRGVRGEDFIKPPKSRSPAESTKDRNDTPKT
jgi:hypothetical protein